MNKLIPHDEPGVPDDENPEWTDEDFRWAVRAEDFRGNHLAVHEFLNRRLEIFRAGAAIGLEKEYFWQFAPTKPGFEDRVAAALGSVLSKTQHAAE